MLDIFWQQGECSLTFGQPTVLAVWKGKPSSRLSVGLILLGMVTAVRTRTPAKWQKVFARTATDQAEKQSKEQQQQQQHKKLDNWPRCVCATCITHTPSGLAKLTHK